MKKSKFKNFICILLQTALFLSFVIAPSFSTNAASLIPAYLGDETVVYNNNVPEFSATEISSTSFETYGDLDALGRCTVAIACVGQDIMPTTERGAIGQVKPTGWKQNKYPGVVNSSPPYLYNRCHLIGYQLTGENANTKNLITGTRYMNVEGMLPYENMVAEYVNTTGNHVMYRVTPIFNGNDLLCTCVKMEALSVEDNGAGISFNVLCYNVQPGVVINYADGSNAADPNYVPQEEQQSTTVTKSSASTSSSVTSNSSYVANKNTKKFHNPTCSSVKDMKEKNKWYYDGSRDDLINKGYSPCKKCNP
ncbi:MAG: DNA/RNA non-specific endonuclease [Lachnospiraceae bacterium]|nr:DNA/RNA non-specific endonuclease [Lachnospiraceae bacterium]